MGVHIREHLALLLCIVPDMVVGQGQIARQKAKPSVHGTLSWGGGEDEEGTLQMWAWEIKAWVLPNSGLRVLLFRDSRQVLLMHEIQEGRKAGEVGDG